MPVWKLVCLCVLMVVSAFLSIYCFKKHDVLDWRRRIDEDKTVFQEAFYLTVGIACLCFVGVCIVFIAISLCTK